MISFGLQHVFINILFVQLTSRSGGNKLVITVLKCFELFIILGLQYPERSCIITTKNFLLCIHDLFYVNCAVIMKIHKRYTAFVINLIVNIFCTRKLCMAIISCDYILEILMNYSLDCSSNTNGNCA